MVAKLVLVVELKLVLKLVFTVELRLVSLERRRWRRASSWRLSCSSLLS